MATRRGTQYTPRTARRVSARDTASALARARVASLPPTSRDLQATVGDAAQDILDPVQPEAPVSSQALPAPTAPAPTLVAPGSAVRIATSTVDSEPINARAVRNICVVEDQARDRELNRALRETVDSLREDIRALSARCDQLDTVIADIKTLRRDVNSLLESARLPIMADQPGQHYPGADPAQPIVVKEASARRPANPAAWHQDSHHREKPSAEGQDQSSFSKMSELLARLARLERSKRDEHDHQERVRRASREHYSRRHRLNRRDDSDSNSSSDYNRRQDDRSSDDSSSEDDRRQKSRRTPRRGDTFRPKGERYNRLKPLRATDSKFKEVLDYRYYRLERTSKSRDLGKLRHQVKRMLATLRRHIFDGREPILILDFLRRYSNECDAQGMSEAQAHCALEHFLEGTAADHYVAVNNSSTADEGGVTCWPEAVHYLLRSYATHDSIREATLRLTSIRQGLTETEEEYSARLNNAAIRCGNVHSMDEKKTIFVDGLIAATKSLVSRYREDHPRSTYLELVQYSSVEGKTHRARTGVTTPKRPEKAKATTPKQTSNPLLKRSRPTLLADRSHALDDVFSRGRRANIVDHVHLLGEVSPANRAVPFSDDTSDLPTTEPSHAGATEEETDPALHFTPRSRPSTMGGLVNPQRLNFDDSVGRTRPGWETPRGHPRPPSPGNVARIICHVCYVKNEHIAPECSLPFKDQWQVVRNYTALTAEEKARVPVTIYYRARAQFADDGTTVPELNANHNGGLHAERRRSDERHPAVLQRAKHPNRSGN